jgi:hypothetical protein
MPAWRRLALAGAAGEKKAPQVALRGEAVSSRRRMKIQKEPSGPAGIHRLAVNTRDTNAF